MQIEKKIVKLPDFQIASTGYISQKFTTNNILTFHQATLFVSKLPYGRNANKNDLTSLFANKVGTCSTKHALLKQLADENNFETIKLIVGLFKMNAINTPETSLTLCNNNLQCIPEAHCYLKFKDSIFDFTKENAKPSDFIDDLIEEIEISPNQITDFKVAYHRNYLVNWLKNNPQIPFRINELWEIREQCIQDLAFNN